MDSPVPSMPSSLHCGNSKCISPVSIHLKDDGSDIVDNGTLQKNCCGILLKSSLRI